MRGSLNAESLSWNLLSYIDVFFHGWGSINPSHATMLSNSLIEVSMYLTKAFAV